MTHPAALRTLIQLVAIELSLLLVFGCAGSMRGPTYTPGLVNQWEARSVPVLTTEPPAIDLEYHFAKVLDGKSIEGPPNLENMFSSWIQNQLKYFPILSRASYGLADAPYKLKIEGVLNLNSKGMYFTTLELHGALSRRGVELRRYEAQGSHTVEMHLIGMPDKYPTHLGAFEHVPTYDYTIRDLFLQLERDANELF